MSKTVTYHYVCDVCGKTADVYDDRTRFDFDALPDGWAFAEAASAGDVCSLECARELYRRDADRRAERLFGEVPA